MWHCDTYDLYENISRRIWELICNEIYEKVPTYNVIL